MIEVSNLSRNFGAFKAVDDVSFAISPGEIVGLLGHNGAGKTTIMKMLTGYIEPSAGKILIDGVDVQAAPLAVQVDMGYLPESPPLYPELTVADYLAHAAQLRGLDAAQCVPQAISATQLQSKAFDRIDTLSRGYKQRLGVAQAILHQPRFLILDEPSNGLDPNQIREMRELIKDLAKNATVILSTHIMQEVNAICDRVLILRNGRLVIDEELKALRKVASARLKTAPEVDLASVLANLAGVGPVVRAAEDTAIATEWQFGLNDSPDQTLALIARTLVAADIPVYHLAAEARDLETVFAEVSEADGLTTNDEGGRDAA